jgi:hypothetical protein
MSMEPWQNDTGTGKPNNSKKNLTQSHFIHDKTHMDWPKHKTGPLWWEASD